ncbi:unnamed protein product [Rotaria sp. Silwood1]|nr:unnamed protein product [Rotaria sp. Silwood1]CAF1619397.1 unnamed protein product [Rotaria sp. Silwood1]CAF3652712.1 unnamed protein product [Rotaria sp. Silwood1]CAF3712537.1 unnamed protein product [Rotaria sp. Silwood1]CAF3773404.1 unnamed protein product [Rotaria sp. Silwood1]
MSSSSSSPKKQLTILFTPIDGFGHVHACIGIAEALKKRGHRIVFGVAPGWKGKLLPYGFEEILYGEETKPSEIFTNIVKTFGNELRKNSYDQLEIFHNYAQCNFVNMAKNGDPLLLDLVKKVKPDIIIFDHYVCQPSLVTAGVPWIWLFSPNPLGLNEENCPPRNSGYPTDSDHNQWDRFRKEVKRIYEPLWEEFNQWLIEQSAPPLTKQMWPFFQNPSPYLNLYLYPEEIDYTDLRPSPLKWFRCNASVRTSESKDEFQLSENLTNKPGKLIYMSMGTIGSADLLLMKRLIEILGKSPHRFIISKGPLGDEYSLPDNMWGEKVVPQIKILPIVDLVITHGGNSTINETLYFGKPSIILPLFYDQFDNAQRLQEKGYGIRLDSYYCSEEELLNAIEKLLVDKELTEKLKIMSKKMKETDNRSKVAELIEALV